MRDTAVRRRADDRSCAIGVRAEMGEAAAAAVTPPRAGHSLSDTAILPIQGFQANLEVSEPGDPLEEEADRIADEVMQSANTSPGRANFGSRSRIARHSLHPHGSAGDDASLSAAVAEAQS